MKRDDAERQRQLAQLVAEFVARAGAAGFTVSNLLEQLRDDANDAQSKRR